ncbi:hypothetical protein FNO01nite_01470 [Flavobacterium noncentrifugens]|uniref:Uncharacterized conserved protein YecE, DUF72 family n=1 Tax=Flavobacterium noncentrifugens TaxID=1128970 RepID=A0A1G8RM22_9FLAO|nr:DUF72 domain-containing protein [Flavobacterium noncentrifugens]GEP49475.1 hypothetical protein FNO01nite_01470 [Flavobacterium noncentrifugens]SDJ17545.1 Uncharacterized conserved protein YecE, DUF72 family [Flavobacterium noncentrifugens]
MQFGKVTDPGAIDFTLPPDAPQTKKILQIYKNAAPLEASVGCAKWNRTELKGFYPRGTKDELAYYSTQFNSIELNATFYGMPGWQQILTWRDKTPQDFKFFPKLTNTISHFKRLINVTEPVENFCNAISNFEDKLGMAFLQLHDNFAPKDYERLKIVLEEFPKGIPLGVEVRNAEWFSNEKVSQDYCDLLEKHQMANIIVDTAGRRDMLHMRLTSPVAFVRYVGANHPSDIQRLDDWVARIEKWRSEGLQKLYFFVHQNTELESPLLAEHFIKNLNAYLNLSLPIPTKQPAQKSMFDDLNLGL